MLKTVIYFTAVSWNLPKRIKKNHKEFMKALTLYGELNLWPPEYEAWVLSTQPQCSVNSLLQGSIHKNTKWWTNRNMDTKTLDNKISGNQILGICCTEDVTNTLHSIWLLFFKYIYDLKVILYVCHQKCSADHVHSLLLLLGTINGGNNQSDSKNQIQFPISKSKALLL
jgi:hypothetical protein